MRIGWKVDYWKLDRQHRRLAMETMNVISDIVVPPPSSAAPPSTLDRERDRDMNPQRKDYIIINKID